MPQPKTLSRSKRLYLPPSEAILVDQLHDWVRNFVQKEYSFLDQFDRQDLIQEGLLNLVNIIRRLAARPPRFNSETEYLFYVKAVVRNGVRDYVLKLRSKFDISLYKLRQHLKATEQSHTDFMGTIGDEYKYLKEDVVFPEDREEIRIRNRRLAILQDFDKYGRDLSIVECRQKLAEVIREVQAHRGLEPLE